MYEQRIKSIYAEMAPEKVQGVPALLKRSKNKEYALYLRIAHKYDVDPEPEFKPPIGDGKSKCWKV